MRLLHVGLAALYTAISVGVAQGQSQNQGQSHGQAIPSLGLNQVFAQAANVPALTPAPQILRELTPPSQPRLSPRLQGPPVRPQQAAPEATPAFVQDATLSGNVEIPAARLQPLIQGLIGRVATPAEVEEARVAVLSAYRQAGYPFISVTAAAAQVTDGVQLRFTVVEGRIAQVRLDGDIGPAGTQVLRFLRQAVTESAATSARLERALLLAGDVPGVTVRGVLRQLEGGASGELELVAEVTRRPFSALINADNRGFRLTGPAQGLFLLQANSFTSFGERTEINLFASALAETVFGQATSEFFVGASGLRVRLYAGAGYTRPGGALQAIGYDAFTRIAGAAATYPIIRSRAANLFASAQFDMYDSTVDTGLDRKIRVSQDAVRVVRAGLDGQYLDSFLPLAAPATTIGNLRVHQGIAGLGATASSNVPGPARAGSQFGFTKVTGEVQRTQPIVAFGNMLLSVQGLVAGQWSNDVLPSSEKYFLGGTRLGRGFYSGQVSGDRAVGVSLEVQLDLLSLPNFTLAPASTAHALELRPAAQFYAFYDAGRTRENLSTDPNRRLESWGGGIRTSVNNTFFLDVEGVHRITRQVDAAGGAVRPLAANAAYLRLMTRF